MHQLKSLVYMQGAQAESNRLAATDTGWDDPDDDADSHTSSAGSSAGSDNSVSPELRRTTSLLISRSLSLGGALLGPPGSGGSWGSPGPTLKPP